MIARVVMGQKGDLEIYGDDYDTPDGTCLRDYIHIMDLADGHLSALRFMDESSGFNVFNLGTGYGVSVLELVNAFRKVSGKEISYRISPRRDGDAPASYADCNKAAGLLGWIAKRSLEEMCESTWRWCEANSSDKQKVGSGR
jgi:UDP-glucose 4-epimerase